MINTMRVIAGGLKPIRYLTFLQIVHAILTGLPTIMMFFVIKELIKPLEPPNTDKLIAYCLIIALIMIVNVLLARRLYLRNFIESYSITTNARLRLADHLRLLSLGFFKRRDPGDISALMLQDMAKVEQIFSHFFTEAVASAVLPLMLGLGLLTEDPRLVGVMVGSLALAVPALIFGQKAVGRLGARQLETRNRASSGILEYVQGINTLKAFSMTGPAFARLNQTLKKLTKDSFSLEAGTALPISAFGLILDLGLVATLAIAAYFLFTGKIALVGFVLFAAVGVKFFEPLLNFAVFFTEMRYMGLAAQRISKVFAEKPLPESPYPEEPNGYDIEFENVSFGYIPGQKTINGINLTFRTGATTALVGPSGGGKTTITGLMARFWDPDSGRILIGGTDIRDMENEKLNSLFSFVFQDVYLFQDTILENIKVGDKSATDEKAMEAAKLARCHEFIEAMEDGYQTRVGEGGATLSGGERQRISIARAILKNAPIVVLDEATASMDPENERNIQLAISSLVKGKTLIVIAHRLKTVVGADLIAVIERGRIEEAGTHESLLGIDGVYRSLWREQEKTGGWKLAKK